MLFVISELIVKFWSTPNRQLANSILAICLPLLLILIYKLLSISLHRYSLKSLPFRNLRGKTIILFAPALDAIGLELVEELSNRGVQLLIALPSPVTDPTNLQIVLLLRQGGNEEIFLESCLLDSSEDTLRFARQWLDAARLPTHSSRLDSLIFLPHPKPDQSFLLLNILLPYLIGQVETGPPIRVIHIDPKPPQASLCRSFQHHLGLRPPLILVPSPPSSSDALWAVLSPLSDISPGLYHLHQKPRAFQHPLDPQHFNKELQSVEAFIRTSIQNKKT
ncbi:hypothetical protein MJO28_013104 [Puccinia striiformis f. sp. tritici]|uniref:Uncharacterized protein n=3 Tax=Puccinia striiformis TaxID=27350 RepID=A0A0L0VHL8_9BASI|nr:hypothetical protein Pst134EA_024418 [Puccinia striiformis f. sp. tritici]KAI9606886.1 hypothetical protein H4Q26_006430 [Puccinia striiformis f. sp. tritici PST-130]KNE98753.1 hypothetical protein PSTG_07940 [Puccinia striiformis f. sp. tritici PST-78]POW02678.1 hypothetical protein PSTT_11576 [Puccinia striiformis]KAH9444854.1 hypothetical protein Pst134EB_025110 [Puccinia striiformis f. sp. tritici]KAH9453549.1 hypothetical protein Pst134EA_024418 [Puccinia striiformis f. sp. tritici]